MNRIVITGATGAIGTALIAECIKNNIEALVITHAGSKRNKNIPDSPLIGVRFCELDDLANICLQDDEKPYDAFCHLAWMGASGPGRNDKALQEKNEEYALSAVYAAKNLGCRVFIGAGSQAEYGRRDSALRPETPCNPENEYGRSKLRAGKATRDLAGKLGIKHEWVRILSVYGPNDGAGSMVMSTIDKLLAGETPRLTRGEQIWDYLYSGDAARALLAVGEKGEDGKIYVLGSGCARPLKDYIEDIREVVENWMNEKGDSSGRTCCRIDLGAVPYSEKQVMFLKADVTKITCDTGWKPQTPFRQGIENILKCR